MSYRLADLGILPPFLAKANISFVKSPDWFWGPPMFQAVGVRVLFPRNKVQVQILDCMPLKVKALRSYERLGNTM